MNKRSLTAVGAVFASLVLMLGVQQAVLITTAAWTDRVDFTAPVTSGTWAPTPTPTPTSGPSKMVFDGDPALYPSAQGKPEVTLQTQVSNAYQDYSKDWAIRDLRVRISFPTAYLGNAGSVAATSSKAGVSWTQLAPPTISGTETVFEFVYNGPPMRQQPSENTGTLSVTFPIKRTTATIGAVISVSLTVLSNDAVAPLNATATYTITAN